MSAHACKTIPLPYLLGKGFFRIRSIWLGVIEKLVKNYI